MNDWRENWTAVVASDVSSRDGLGWEFSSLSGKQEGCWEIFREDGGPFPVFSSARAEGTLPPQDELGEMTITAVVDLLAAADLTDENGWMARNITAALLLASHHIVSWEGEEWALESGPNDEASVWAAPSDARTPYAWLRAKSTASDFLIDIYQDDANFGLSFASFADRRLPESDVGSLRSRRDIPLIEGRITQVEVAYDTTVEGCSSPGLVTEILLRGERASTHLIAAEAYSRNEWHLYDESIVALTNPTAADALDWTPTRQPW